jgi:hypothetical protein
MAKSPIGTVEWFRNRARGIIAHARAIDDFGSATRSFQKLIELGLGGDLEVHAALHTAGVIAYARPFSGPLEFPKRQISEGLGFKNEIHEQLLLLRHKLVAHSDAKFAD